jgi:hypothetical protein
VDTEEVITTWYTFFNSDAKPPQQFTVPSCTNICRLELKRPTFSFYAMIWRDKK